ncbi:conserved hypothetical protein [Ricinus communis]|uniref:Uncharacterized protein n=1 Tax=Ricinus communis TaxID=3988 RepID=B9SLL3_RICCO|nr:conserved hypothetical protein [Ricinus communis]
MAESSKTTIKDNAKGPDFKKVVTSASGNFSDLSWTPMDDKIEVRLPGNKHPATSKEVDAYIDKVLYIKSSKKRLSVFTEICPKKE